MRRSLLVGSLCALLWACPTEPGPIPDVRFDGGASDASDSGHSDSGPADSGPADTGTPDSGRPDSGIDDPGPFAWPLPTGLITITPDPSWKNRITVPTDPFFFFQSDQALDGYRWVKFSVLVRDPTKVYFQDGFVHRFHADFASDRLDPFNGMTRAEIDRVSLHEAGQEVIFGAVLVPRLEAIQEYAIQLEREDAYHPEMVRIVHDLVVSAIDAPPTTRGYYFPTYHQAAEAEHWRPWLLARGVTVDSSDRWLTHNGCYSPGWALGRLVHVPGAELSQATREGRLLPTDVLLTDAAATTLPFVAGVLSLSPSAPSDRVALLARAYGVPFAHFVSADDRVRAQALVGHDVLFETSLGFFECGVRLVDLDGQLPPAHRAEVLALKEPAALAVRAKTVRGAISADVDDLGDADWPHFGGEVVRYALLRDTIPGSTQDGTALSFDLWDALLDRTLASTGTTLRSEIEIRLSRQSDPPVPSTLDADLSAIRGLFAEATFDAPTRQAILDALTGLGADRRLRISASTNVEDGASFVGEGLYRDEVGCLADDLDGDELGPSACDARSPNEVSAVGAILSVYASFYGYDAVQTRLRLSVDEAQIGVAVLVRRAREDDDAIANSLGTFVVRGNSADATMVSQAGARSISDNTNDAVAEIANAYVGSLGIYFDLLTRSSLARIADTVMTFPDDYDAFAGLFQTVADRYALSRPGLVDYTLDFDTRKSRSQGLVVDAVRRVPRYPFAATVPTYLAATPRTLCTFQGEQGDAFAAHRLKVRVTLSPRGSWLGDGDLGSSLYAGGAVTFVDGATTATILGAPASWPSPAFERDGDATIDRFDLGPDRSALRSNLTRLVRPLESPVKLVGDSWVSLEVVHATPVPVIDWQGVSTRAQDNVNLAGCPEDNVVGPNNLRHAEVVELSGIRIETAYWWPEPPRGPTAGYTAPLYRWDSTTITGLTSAPIVLRSYWSQTYRPGHHNFTSDYILDPWLEPGIAESVKDELRAANVRFLYTDSQALWALGLDGVLRQL